MSAPAETSEAVDPVASQPLDAVNGVVESESGAAASASGAGEAGPAAQAASALGEAGSVAGAAGASSLGSVFGAWTLPMIGGVAAVGGLAAGGTAAAKDQPGGAPKSPSSSGVGQDTKPEVPSVLVPETARGSGTAADPIIVKSDGTVNIGVSEGADWYYSKDGGRTWTPGSGSGISADDLNEGSNTIKIVQVDKSGHVSEPIVIEVVKDTTPPDAPVVNVPGAAGADGSGSHGGNGSGNGAGTAEDPIVVKAGGTVSVGTEPGADWSFSTDGGTTWKPGSGSGISADDLNEGNNSVQIVQVDQAGNVSEPTTIEIVKDTTRPAAPGAQAGTSTGNTGGITGNGSSNGTGTVDDPIVIRGDGTVGIGIDPGSDWNFSTDGGQTWKPGTGTGISADDLQEGNNTIQIVQVDKAGNPSAPTTVEVVKDTTAPTAPAAQGVGAGSGASGAGTAADPIVIKSDGTVNVGTEPGADWNFSTDGGQTWKPGTGTGISADDLQEGNNTIQIVQVDKAGNPSAPTTVEVVKDTTAPTAPAAQGVGAGSGASGAGTAADPIVIKSDGTVNVGTEPGADWNFSTDGGQTWKPGTGTGISADDLQEGNNTIQIVQVDKAGNPSAPTTVEVVKDTTAPTAPAAQGVGAGSGASGAGTAADPIVIKSDGTVNVGTEPGADWNFSTDGGQTWKPGTGTGISADDLQEGNNTIQIVQVDKAGNPSAPTTVEVVKDTTAPTAPATQGVGTGSGATGAGTAADPIVIKSDGTVNVGTEAGADWNYSTDGGQTWKPGTGSGISADDLHEGNNSIQIVQVDKAGNASAPTTVEVVKDTTAPTAPATQGVGTGSGATGAGTAADPIVIKADGSVNVGVETGADWNYSTDGGQTWRPGTGSGISADDLHEGNNSIQIVQVDKAGNPSAPTTVEVVKDTTAPTAPAAQGVGTGSGATGAGTAADPIVIKADGSVNVGVETGADWNYSTDGGQTWRPGTGSGISADDLHEGNNSIQIVQVDKAGNASAPTTVEVVKDTTAPTAPATQGVGTGTGATGTGTAADPIVIKADGSVNVGVEAGANWNYSTDGGKTWKPGTGTGIAAADLKEGNNSIQIVQVDKAGNASAPTTVEVVKDTTAPTAPATQGVGTGSGATGAGTAADPIVIKADGSVNVGVEAGADWNYSTDGGKTWKPGTGTGIAAGDLKEGNNSIQIVQVDKAGNASAPTTVEVVKDTTAPTAPATQGVGTGTGATGTGTAADPIVIKADGSVNVGVEAGANWNYSTDGGKTWKPGTGTGIAAADLKEGNNSIQIVQVDKAGNASAPTTVEVVKDTTAPTAPATQGVGTGSGATGAGTAADPIVIKADGSVNVGVEAGADWNYSTDGGKTWKPGTGTGISADDLQEGNNTIQIVQVDKAGNPSAPTTVEVVKDTTAPTAPAAQGVGAGSGASGAGTAADPIVIKSDGTVNVGTEPGADWNFSTDGGQTWKPGTGTGISADDLQEGNNTIQIVQVDKAGNPSAPTTVEVVKDTTAPTAPAAQGVGSGATGAGTAADPILIKADGSVNVGTEAGADWRFSTDGGQTWKPGTGTGIAAADLNEGNNTIQIVQVDKAGNPSAPTTVEVVKDTTAPTAPAAQGVGAGSGASGAGTAADPILIKSDGTVNVGTEPGADWNFSTDGGQTWKPGTGTGISADDLQEGNNTIQIVQVDKAGNPSAPTTVEVVKDTTAPTAPAAQGVGAGSGASGAGTAADPIVIKSDGTVNVGTEPGADWNFSTDGGQTWKPGTGTGISADDLQEGNNTIQIVQVDKAGNPSAPTTVEVVKDTTAPTAPAAQGVGAGSGASGAGTAADPIVIKSDGTVNVGTEPGADWNFSTDGGQTWKPGTGTGISADDLQEGNNTIQIVQVDKAGNPSAPTTVEVVKDTTAPTAPAAQGVGAGSGASGAGTAADPIVIKSDGTVNVGTEPGADWNFSTDGGQTWKPGTGTGISADDLQEGNNTIQIVQVDKAGNPSAPTTVEVVKDTTAPTAPAAQGVGSGATGAGTAADPILIKADGSVNVGTEAGADWRFSTDGGKTWKPGTGTGIAAADLNEGNNTIQIVQVDKAGNPSAPTTVEVVKDTTAPAAPATQGVGSGTGATGAGTAADPIVIKADGSVNVVTEAGADWRFSTDGGKTWKPGTGTGIAAADLNEGNNTIQIVQVDKAGNPSAPTTVEVVKDTTAPTAPAAQGVGSGSGASGAGTAADPIVIKSDGTVNVGTEAGADWRFSTDGGKTWKPGTGTGIAAADLNEGNNTIQIVQVDKAGNPSAPTTVEVVKDTTAPTAPATQGVGSGTGATGAGTAADPIVIKADGSVNVVTEAGADWRFSTDGGKTWKPGTGTGIAAADLKEGNNTIQIVQVDKAGNTSAPTIVEVVKDTMAPVAPVAQVAGTGSGATGTGTIADPLLINADGSVNVGIEAGADWRFSTDGGQTWKPGTGTAITAADLNEGNNSIQVVQVDKAGNVSLPTMVEVIKDTTAPTLPGPDLANSTTGSQSHPAVSGTGTTQDPIVVNADGRISVTTEADAQWRYSTDGGTTWRQGTASGIESTDLVEGANTIQIVQFDRVGNASQMATVEVFKDTTAPFEPVVDLSAYGSGQVTLNGSGKLNLTIEPGAEWRFSLDAGLTWTTGSGTALSASSLKEGANSVQIVQMDRAGNLSTPTTFDVVKDSFAAKLSISATNIAGYAADGRAVMFYKDNPTIVFNNVEAGGHVEVWGNGKWIDFSSSSSFSPATEYSGGYQGREFRQVDAYGNASASVSIQYWTVAPFMEQAGTGMAVETPIAAGTTVLLV
ncbi:hypothetical protein OU995_25195 [Roseateles sp. SL47]|uniref:hypothetical protein n=1 Tax=Roseateles sp. SL47 TaxID=2995138 RepID=UPI00226F7B09|nr:hypothetical protein [Roseateles sp. SL47]WAC72783.1 hypothetical protein OU995_25195 [Roseateles sp. SL47]